MKSQLSDKQWNQVVTEVTRLAQEREDERTQREITAQVLQELNLPTDLIDDALQQVRYREALARQRRQRLWLGAAGTVLVLLLVISWWTWSSSRAALFARIQAEPGRVTRRVEQNDQRSSVAAAGQEVFYRVTLRDVPLGENLQLACDWIDPAGKIQHQARWETRATDKAVWDTHCRCQLPKSAPPGQWKVEMKLGERVLTVTEFKVE